VCAGLLEPWFLPSLISLGWILRQPLLHSLVPDPLCSFPATSTAFYPKQGPGCGCGEGQDQVVSTWSLWMGHRGGCIRLKLTLPEVFGRLFVLVSFSVTPTQVPNPSLQGDYNPWGVALHHRLELQALWKRDWHPSLYCYGTPYTTHIHYLTFFCGAEVWAQLHRALCSGSCHVAMKVLAKMCSQIHKWLV
jgi:hypothetical protein